MSASTNQDESARHRALIEERDYLFASLDDLDAELAAGDLAQDDYATLRAEYTRRAAVVIDQLAGREPTVQAETVPRSYKGIWVTLAVLAVTGIVGVMLAQGLGARGGAGLTGSQATPDDAMAQCQSLSFQDPAAAESCYAPILETQPSNVQALTYAGWAQVRAGDVAAGMARFDKVVSIDPKYSAVYVFRAVVAKNAGNFVQANSELETFYANDPDPGEISTMKSMQLDQQVAKGLLAPVTAKCWDDLKPAIETFLTAANAQAATPSDLITQGQKVRAAMHCFDPQLNATPLDADAAVMWAIGQSSIAGVFLQYSEVADVARQLLVQSRDRLDAALQQRPNDASALVVRAAVNNLSGEYGAAKSDIDAVGQRRINALFSSIDVAAMRDSIYRNVRGT